MNLLGLKGFSNYGRIQQHFTEGCFPDKWNWTIHDVETILNTYKVYREYAKKDNYLCDEFGIPRSYPSSDDYLLICYSDGGLPGHILAASDPRCKGIIAHSATFAQQLVEDTVKYNTTINRQITKVPVLLIQNYGDKTKYMPSRYGKTRHAERYYYDHGYPLEVHTVPSTTWFGHDFDNAFGIMASWCQRNFSYRLPVK